MYKMIKVAQVLSILGICCLLKISANDSNSVDFNDSIDEELPVGHKLSKTLNNKVPSQYLTKPYTFHAPNADYFEIDREAGTISIVRRIDYEDIELKRKNYNIVFIVNIFSESQLVFMINVNISIKDINDNGCSFEPHSTQEVLLFEDARIGEEVTLNIPDDPDRDFSIQRNNIYLMPTSDMFELVKRPRQNSYQKPFDLSLKLLKELDFETTKSYPIVVIAGDGNAAHTCQLQVTVKIRDVDDNVPKFMKDEYAMDVSENSTLNQKVLGVRATDVDTEENYGQVFYAMEMYPEANVKETFEVDRSTGDILLKKKLDYTRQKTYNFKVMATSGRNHRGSSTQVTINVIDINDNAPKITFFQLKTKKTKLSIIENFENHVDFAQVTIVDGDTGDGGKVSCSLQEIQTIEAFSMKAYYTDKIYIVTSLKPFDREKIEKVNFKIKCNDHGKPSLSSELIVDVHIEDVNDNAPKFNQTNFYIDVYEDSKPTRKANQYLLTSIQAKDADADQNGNVTYKIKADDTRVMSLIKVELDGRIRSNGNLDREDLDKFEFMVVATDNAPIGQRKSATTTIHVTVLDYNDHEPRFKEHNYKFIITENVVNHSFVGLVVANDLDFGRNAQLKLSIVQPNGMQLPFQLVSRHRIKNNSTQVADIFTSDVIDRESVIRGLSEAAVYSFNVVAEDQPSEQPHLRTTVPVTIFIKDENDEAPVFTFPNNSSRHVDVSYKEDTGYQFATVRAMDPDEGENGKVRYTLESGDTSNLFSLDRNSGALRLARNPTSMGMGTYTIRLLAQDMGPKPHTVRETIWIKVTDNPPLGNGNSNANGNAGDPAINLYIIIAIVVASFIISMVLLTAICVVLRRSRRENVMCSQDLYKNTGEYTMCPMNAIPPVPQHNPYHSTTLPLISAQNRHELTFVRNPSVDNITLGPLKPPPPYHSVPGEDKRSSLASGGDRDSGNGDSVDVNTANRCMVHAGAMGAPGGPDYYHPNTSSTLLYAGHGHQQHPFSTFSPHPGTFCPPSSGTSTFMPTVNQGTLSTPQLPKHRMRTFAAPVSSSSNAGPPINSAMTGNGTTGRQTPRLDPNTSYANNNLQQQPSGYHYPASGTLTIHTSVGSPSIATSMGQNTSLAGPTTPYTALTYDSRSLISLDNTNTMGSTASSGSKQKNNLGGSFV